MTSATSQTTVRPLDGLKVIDTATFLAGPFCATQLAEFGADVIKVEQPGLGDAVRRFGTITEGGDSLPFLSENRNKKSITLDLRRPAGADLLKRLVADTDILVENFQPGTLEEWGLGWEVLSAINPRLIMVRISGFGQTGPYKSRPGFGRIGNAFGGLAFLAGYPDRPPVTPGSATLPDYMSGIYGALGALLAVQAREKTGRGQVVDIGLYEPMFRMLDELAPAYHLNGYVRQRMGPGTVNVVPHSHYPTFDRRWIAIACTSDKIFARLAAAMGVPEFADAGKWGTIRQREAEREGVDAYVGKWTSSLTRDQILALCDQFQVPCGPVYAIDEIFEDPQYKARGNIAFVKDERVGELAVPNVVPRMSDTPGGITGLGPRLGAHNEEIYAGRLGLSADDIRSLQKEGTI
ncbi:CaiB/BaiF CoA-transferase family protein [Hydrogenophaga sp.]|uniref:CaiB/BaiF CoA transferase family protein n=1 Tax=Hydrogenophaga sp. TaxID=1904254 RepID=UPI00271C5042|nr:CoA transferase [Hydrogenophaga sp.]MDO9435370.1 CoA transferase [Hydrogenophaga sp.]